MTLIHTWQSTSTPKDNAISIRHVHRSCEFLLITDGAVRMNIGEKEYRLYAGDMAVIPALETHDLYPECFPYSRIGFHIDCDHLNMLQISPILASILIFKSADRNQAFSLQDQPIVCSLIRRLHEELICNNPYREDMSRLLFHELLLHLYRIAQNSFRCSRGDLRMEEARLYIESHFGDQTSVEEIAAGYYLSTSHFIACFKEYTGFTPHRYRKLCRVAHARKLLIEGKSSLSEIAEICGFSDSGSFIRSFRETMQITPMKFRENFRGNDDYEK